MKITSGTVSLVRSSKLSNGYLVELDYTRANLAIEVDHDQVTILEYKFSELDGIPIGEYGSIDDAKSDLAQPRRVNQMLKLARKIRPVYEENWRNNG